MINSSNGSWTFSALLAVCEGNPPVDSPHRGTDAELCYFSYAPEQTVDETIQTPAIWDVIALIMTSL